MADGEIQINVKGPSELKLQISISTEKTVLDLKQAIAGKSDVEAERQRLIYSGRVLKESDEDKLSVYKIQSGHTVHMVKGQARQQATASSSTPQQIPNMQAGQSIHDPLTQLNSHLGFGAMAGLNPFADLGVNPNDPNMMASMMNDPRVLEQMANAMSNPAVIDQVIAMNPQLAPMAPRLRQLFQSEEFRRVMSDPQQLQGMMRMANMMRSLQGGGGGGGPMPEGFLPPPGFPAPGVPGQTSPPQSTASNPVPGTTVSSTTSPMSPSAGATPNPLNPFGMDPALMQQLLFGGGGLGGGLGGPLGGGGPGGGGLGSSFGGMGSPPPPTDTRPPEERFQVQLQQLQDMGFTNASQNVRALLATGGNVHSAIEYILNGGGL